MYRFKGQSLAAESSERSLAVYSASQPDKPRASVRLNSNVIMRKRCPRSYRGAAPPA